MGAENGQKSSYVPLSRGIKPYLEVYSPSAIKVYICLLIDARFNGKKKGEVEFTFAEMQKNINMNFRTVKKSLIDLAMGIKNSRSGKKAPPFIKIIKLATARGQKNRVLILKAKLTVKDFHGKKSDTPPNGKNILDELAKGVARQMGKGE